jgi:hypothetical protein
LRDLRRFVLTWFAAVGIITLAVVPIRLYILSVSDWLVGALASLALLFFIIYFLLAWLWNPKRIATP